MELFPTINIILPEILKILPYCHKQFELSQMTQLVALPGRLLFSPHTSYSFAVTHVYILLFMDVYLVLSVNVHEEFHIRFF